MTARESEIIGLIRKEVKPALGCTEPIAVALAVAKAMEVMEEGLGRSGWRGMGNTKETHFLDDEASSGSTYT